jgi:hypothetical protein
MMAKTIQGEIRMGKPKTHNPKRRRELVSLMVGSYFTHDASNVTNMQIVRSNSNGRSKISIIC